MVHTRHHTHTHTLLQCNQGCPTTTPNSAETELVFDEEGL
jgi:hypothetical protein